MRIVHQIYNKTEAGASIKPYRNKINDKTPAKGGFVDDLLIVSKANKNTPCHTEEAIYIEGDAAHIYNALKSALHCLDICAQDLIEKGQLDPNWKETK